MSIESEILRIQHNIANAYATVSERGGEVPLQPTSANLAQAVASIPAGATITAGDGLTKDVDTLNVDNPVRGIVTQAEFDALTEAQKASGTYFVDDGQSGGSGGEVYDDQERVIGTWFGKPLYQRAFVSETGSTLGQYTTVGIIGPNDVPVMLFGWIIDSYKNMVMVSSSTEVTFIAATETKNISVSIASANIYLNRPIYAIIKYTKTTDTEVSA